MRFTDSHPIKKILIKSILYSGTIDLHLTKKNLSIKFTILDIHSTKWVLIIEKHYIVSKKIKKH